MHVPYVNMVIDDPREIPVYEFSGGASYKQGLCYFDGKLFLTGSDQKKVKITTKKKTGSLEGQNLAEKVIFFDKKHRLVLVPVAEVMEAAPSLETILVMCKRDQADIVAIEEAKHLFKKWFKAHKAELAQETLRR